MPKWQGDEIKITIETDGTFETVQGSILGDTNLTVTRGLLIPAYVAVPIWNVAT